MEEKIKNYFNKRNIIILWIVYIFTLLWFSISMQDVYKLTIQENFTSNNLEVSQTFYSVIIGISHFMFIVAQLLGVFSFSLFIYIMLKTITRVKYRRVVNIYLATQVPLMIRYIYLTVKSNFIRIDYDYVLSISEISKLNALNPFLLFTVIIMYFLLKLILELKAPSGRIPTAI